MGAAKHVPDGRIGKPRRALFPEIGRNRNAGGLDEEVMRPGPSRVLVICQLLLAGGCASPLSAAVNELEAGQSPRALARLRALGPNLEALTADQRVRYALYRGLTHLALGDAPSADLWLCRARAATARDPLLLSVEDRSRLLAGLRAVGRMPGE